MSCEFINEFWIYVWTHKPKNSKFFLFPIFAKSLHTPAFYKWMKISSLEIDLKFFFYYFEIKSELLLPRQSSLSGCIISTVAATLKGQVKFQNDEFRIISYSIRLNESQSQTARKLFYLRPYFILRPCFFRTFIQNFLRTCFF